jgi:hypothetical protein
MAFVASGGIGGAGNGGDIGGGGSDEWLWGLINIDDILNTIWFRFLFAILWFWF